MVPSMVICVEVGGFLRKTRPLTTRAFSVPDPMNSAWKPALESTPLKSESLRLPMKAWRCGRIWWRAMGFREGMGATAEGEAVDWGAAERAWWDSREASM